VDKQVVLGIRPEAIKSTAQRAGKNHHRQQVTVDAIEQMGNEILVYALLGNSQIISRFSPDAKVETEGVADLYWNLDKVHFFDGETEAVIK
jgi:multiple sugar transport system ATP-binding protein